jgi:hypothetical protein
VPVGLADHGLAQIDIPAGMLKANRCGIAGRWTPGLGIGTAALRRRQNIELLDGHLIHLDGVMQKAAPVERRAQLIRIDAGKTAAVVAGGVEILPINHRPVELQRRELRVAGVQRVRSPLGERGAKFVAMQITYKEHPRREHPDNEEHYQSKKGETQAGEDPVHDSG